MYSWLWLMCWLAMGHNPQWQTGIDFTINDLKTLERTSSYPVHMVKEILFPRVFDELPQVLLMIETLDFQNGKDVDISVFVGAIEPDRFELRYRLGGPAIIQKLKVRWVAMVDQNVQVHYHDLGFMDLKELRQGEGERFQEIDVTFPDRHHSVPRVATFITGFKINPDGDSYCLIVEPDDVTHKGMTMRVVTRYHSKVRYVNVAVLSTSDKSFVLSKGGIDENALSYFEIDKVRDGIARQNFELDIPEEYFLHPQHNILSAGLSGFDVQVADEGFVDLMVEHYFLREGKFHLSFGTKNTNCKLYEMDFFVLLHLPALPEQINEARIEQQNRLMQQQSKKT